MGNNFDFVSLRVLNATNKGPRKIRLKSTVLRLFEIKIIALKCFIFYRSVGPLLLPVSQKLSLLKFSKFLSARSCSGTTESVTYCIETPRETPGGVFSELTLGK